MKALDRLIIKAKKKCGADLKLHFGMIYRSEKQPEKWVTRGDLWNGIPGSGVTSASCLCDSIEEAEKVLQELAEKYPNNKDVVVLIDDLAE